MCRRDTATSASSVFSSFQRFYFLFSVGAAFYVAVLCHTPYVIPWIYTPSAIYGLLRVIRYRLSDTVFVPVGNQMTLVGESERPYLTHQTRSIEGHYSSTSENDSIIHFAVDIMIGKKYLRT